MGRTAHFEKDQFLQAAARIAAQKGPAEVSIAGVASSIGAPVGSLYHRYRSRAEMLGDVWMSVIEDFQDGFHACLTAFDDARIAGREAALYTPRWVTEHGPSARILVLNRRRDFESDAWPAHILSRELRASRALRAGMARYMKKRFGPQVSEEDAARTRFALIDAPSAAVRPYLEARRALPKSVTDFVRLTYDATMQ